MKKKLIFGLLCLLSFTTVVNAEESTDPLASIIKDGFLYVDTSVPTNESEFNNVKAILNEQYKEYLQDDDTSYNKSLYLTDCSEDYSSCYLIYSGCIVNDGCGDKPTQVTVTWKESYSELFNEIAPNKVFEVKAITPTNDKELYSYVSAHLLSLYPGESITGDLTNCNTDYTKCDLTINNFNANTSETNTVTVKWQETNLETKKSVDNYINQIVANRPTTNNGTLTFTLSDLNKINYLSHTTLKNDFFAYIHEAVKYSPEAQKLFNNNNYEYVLHRYGVNDEAAVSYYSYGIFTLHYNGIAYGIIDNALLQYKNVIYIPDDTENTKEAYMAAAKKRIDEYLGNNNTKIEVAGKRNEYLCLSGTPFDFSTLGDELKMGDYYYNITIGDITQEFVIIRDSNNSGAPTYDAKDENTNITISSSSSNIPLDTIIKVDVVDIISEAFTKINEVLKLNNKEEVQVYDFKLFSQTTNKYITKLTTGEFKVSVPIKESLKGKELVAYYVTDNNEIEEHPVTVVDNFATFTTTHFSIYTIAEKKETEDPLNEQIPPTLDGIMNYVVIGMIGLIGLGTTGIILKKREN